MRTHLFLAFALVGCAATPGVSDDVAGDDTMGDDAPPFTNGTSTLSGAAEPGYLDGKRGHARFNNPVNVLVHDGTVYVADFDNSKIRMLDADGTATTLIAQPDFQRPFAMTFGPDGRLYVTTDKATDGSLSDMTGTVWRVDIPSCTATVVAAKIGRPRGIAWWNGKLAVSDYDHHVIQLVDPANGHVTLYAGAWDAPGMVDAAGLSARFAVPYGLAVDTSGRLVVADFNNHRIRAITPAGQVATLLMNGNSQFEGLAVTASGDIFVTDVSDFRVKRIRGTTVETVAGNGMGGYNDNDDNLAAQFYGLEGLSVTSDGSMLYVADGNRGEDRPFNRVRQIKLP